VDTGGRIIRTAHDEIILEVPEKMVKDVADILERMMIEAGKAFLFRVPVEAEVAIGETWAEK
jgi:DNA polymerase-1/twinkle protein